MTDEYNIPPDLRNCGRSYVVWRAEDRGNAKPSKVPHTKGGLARVNDPKTWLTFDEALALYDTGQYHGIGLVITKELELIGLDFDKCVDPGTGEILRFDEHISSVLAGPFYVEYSPSGAGIRAFTYGRLAQDYNQGGIEIYAGNGPRYLTLTGNVIRSAIGAGQKEINTIIESLGIERLSQVRPAYVNPHTNRGNEQAEDDPLPLYILQDALKHIHPARCPYQSNGIEEADNGAMVMGWINIGMVLHHNAKLLGDKDLDLAFKLWDQWSQYDPDRYRPGNMEYKWRSFGKYKRPYVGVGTLFKCARMNGWGYNLGAYYRQNHKGVTQ